MIEVDYNEYKETIEENMRLIPENHKLKEEIERLNNKLNMIKTNIDTITKEEILDIIENYTGMFGIEDSDKE